MAYLTEYRPRQGIVVVKHVARTDYFEARNALVQGARLMKRHLSTLALLDLVEAVLTLSLPELYFLVLRFSDLHLPHSSRFAFMWAGDGTNRAAAQFYNILSRSLNCHTAAFMDRESAEAWLVGDPGADGENATE
jgi:hypothetical protein